MKMTKCVDCNNDFEGHDSQCIRCASCQKKFRKNKNNKWNKSAGTARRTAELNQWANVIKLLTADDIMPLITAYKDRLKFSRADDYGFEKTKELRTRIKILTVLYKKAKGDRGSPKFNIYGKDSICEDCRFYNKRQLRCTLHTETEQDKAIKTGVCSDYAYDKENKYKEEYYKQDVERNNNNDDDLGDYNYYQYDEGGE